MIIYRKLRHRLMQMHDMTQDVSNQAVAGERLPHTSVRQIPIGTCSVTGKHAAGGTPYESSLERDFLTICAFDYKVETVLAQPLQIPFEDETGQPRTYTPDFLVYYRRDLDETRDLRHLLCEIKPKEKLKKADKGLLARLEAGKVVAQQNGWDFKVLTEEDIRTPYLANVGFLLPYREDGNYDAERAQVLIGRIGELGETDPHILLTSLFRDKSMQASHLSILWSLIASFRVRTDLMQPLTMRSRIWLNS